ncbi:MAG: uL14 family ribosomal protein [Candidatus Micrarchaeia archaeon]
MKPISSHITKGLTIGSFLNCDDNSGAKVVQIIGIVGRQSKRGRNPRAGIGDVAIVAVKKGTTQMVKKIERAVIIRQKKPIRRANGIRIMFEDNACALIDETGVPKGTEIKGVIAREVAERFPKVSAIAWGIV